MTRTFLMLCGGPGLHDPKDPKHDKGWDNYVHFPLSLKGNFPATKEEQVLWLIYKPAYDKRWIADQKNNPDEVARLKKNGFFSYTDLLEKRAAEPGRGWTLKWISGGNELWTTIQTLKSRPVSRFWYFGHARDDLWLSLEHDANHVAVRPADKNSVVWTSDIKASLAPFIAGGQKTYDTNKSAKLFGCNTVSFATTWAKTFKVYAEGASGTLDFGVLDKTTDHVHPAGCTWKKYKPDGTEL